jgi:uncharacterized protein
MNMTRQAFIDLIAPMPVISVHEHHHPAARFCDANLDTLLLESYVGWINPCSGAIADRALFLDHVRHNAYFVWLEKALRLIYGIEKITVDNWDAISETLRQAYAATPTWHIDLLRTHARYRYSIEDAYWEPGSAVGYPDLFRPSFRVNSFIMCHHPAMKDNDGNSPWDLLEHAPADFDEYLAAVEGAIVTHKAAGAVALKSAVAYERDLAFAPHTQEEAARAFGTHPASLTDAETRAFQDFMFDYLCTLAARHDLPFQNHTGLGRISGSNPMNLEPAIARHPDTKFVLFHGGYPWVGEIAGLAHNYANVYPDLTWLPLISPTAAVRAIHEWLEAAKSSRSICWGADCWWSEESVGAVLAFKHVLAQALAHKVDEGYFDLEEAECVARRLCYENAERLYRLPANRGVTA